LAFGFVVCVCVPAMYHEFSRSRNEVTCIFVYIIFLHGWFRFPWSICRWRWVWLARTD